MAILISDRYPLWQRKLQEAEGAFYNDKICLQNYNVKKDYQINLKIYEMETYF